MKIVRIVKAGQSTFKPVCKFTPDELVPIELQEKEFLIENMISSKGFLFFVGPILEQPEIEEIKKPAKVRRGN